MEHPESGRYGTKEKELSLEERIVALKAGVEAEKDEVEKETEALRE